MNYATIEKELLCVIATLHKFHSMMLGAQLRAHTDQKILELHYVQGPRNVIDFLKAFAQLRELTLSGEESC
jgi:hypothetical protein